MTETDKKAREPVKPLTLDERVRRYLANPRPKVRKRLVHELNFAFGHALNLRGAVKKSKLTKLGQLVSTLPEKTRYTIPAKAQEALDGYAEKENACA